MSSNEQLTKEKIAGEQKQTFSEPTARSRSMRSSGSDARPPRGIRSRSPPVPKQAAPVQIQSPASLQSPAVLSRAPWDQPPQPWSAKDHMIDWPQMNRQTALARVAVLRNMLDKNGMSDRVKLIRVGEKMEHFDIEDVLLDQLEYLETKDGLPPESLEEHNRQNDVKMLIAEGPLTRTLLYSGVEIPGDMYLSSPRQQRRMNRDR